LRAGHRPAEEGGEGRECGRSQGGNVLPAKQPFLVASSLHSKLERYTIFGDLFWRIVMCDNNVGVAKRLDLESISQDIAKLVKELDKEVEGKVQVSELKKIEAKVRKIIAA